VAELIAKTPLGGRAPLILGAAVLAEWLPGPMQAIAPFPGRDKAVARALKPLGLDFPAPGTVETGAGGARLVWAGRELAFLIGATAPAMPEVALVSDQSDGWAGLRLTGAAAAEVLARLCPLDLNPAVFPPGRVARAPLQHMAAVILREDEGFAILVFRSMAETAWHEISAAMKALAARAALTG